MGLFHIEMNINKIMIDKLKLAWETFHPRCFTVSLKKQYPDVYKWVIDQEIDIITKTLSDKVFVILNPIRPKCKSNKCPNLVHSLDRNGWVKYCSSSCKGKDNSLNFRNKARETSLKNWGVENPAQHEDIKNKMKDTMVERYGVEFAKRSPLIQNKTKETMVERYGVEFAIQHPDFREKIKNTCIEKYGVENSSQKNISKDTWEKLSNQSWLMENNKLMSMDALSQSLGVSVATLSKHFRILNIDPVNRNKSTAEIEITNYIADKLGSDYNIQTGTKKLIYPFEIDIYLEQHGVGIEYNGSWYHSEINGKERDYHIGKTKLCAAKNVKLIHIWEHEYKRNKDIILSKINHICGKSKSIYGRKCQIKEITTEEAKSFLNLTHIQGPSINKVRMGLYYLDELVAVMTFGKTRFNKNYEWELLRYSSKLYHNIVGGFSKLLKYFINKYSPKSIITYSDKGWSVGDVYKSNGFSFLKTIPPSYFYTNDYVKFHNRINFQKKKLPKILAQYDDTLTEWENMKNNGYDRIWNCGNDSWVWINTAC